MVWHDFDMMELLKDITDSLDPGKKFHHDPRLDAQERVLAIAQKAKYAMKLLDRYTTDDERHIYRGKWDILLDAKKAFHDLRARAEYYQTHGPADLAVLQQSFAEVKKLMDRYADIGGSVYLFRHCEKANHPRLLGGLPVGAIVTGIPSHAVKKEAYGAAEMLLDEILISPRPVEIYFYWSEAYRTELFAKLVDHHIGRVNQITQHNGNFTKVTCKKVGFEPRIRFGHWDKEGLDEIDPLLRAAKSPKEVDELFLSWFEKKAPVVNMKKQPTPESVVNAVEDFMKEGMRHASGDSNAYRIIIGFSHSWVIDALLFHKFPNLLRYHREVIKTGAYCKAECRHLEYRRDWTPL
jgi:broad specificity phosphatase PhoE